MDRFKTGKKYRWRTSLMGCALSVLLTPGAAWALGLGNIQVNSTLEQPLKAQIELLDVSEQQLEYLRVNLADEALFSRMGLQRTGLLDQLQFDVKQLKDGRYIIEVSTEQPLTEPFLNFLVDVDWGSGRSFREFTILLDPPVFQEGAGAAQVSTPEVVPSRIIEEAEPSVIEPPAVTAEPEIVSTPTPVVVDTAEYINYGPVKRGEMLWNIANDNRPADVSVNQMMLALLKENPEAFFGDNVNMLKEGAILRIADADTIRAFTTRQAMVEIARQNKAWLEYRRQRQAASAIASESASGELHGERVGEPGEGLQSAQVQQKHLELVAPEGDDAARAAAASEIQSLEKQIKELNDQITLSRESATAAQEENRELNARLEALKDQMEAMQSLIALKDQELEMLRSQSIPGEVDRATSEPVMTLETLDEQQQKLEPTQEAKPEMPSTPNIWRDPLVLATLGGVAFLLVMLGWLLSRNRKREQSLEEFDQRVSQAEAVTEEEASDFHAQDTEVVPEEALTELQEESEFEKPAMDVSEAETVVAEPAAEEEPSEFELPAEHGEEVVGEGMIMEPDSSVEGQAVDPITEADLYIAYEKYEKANEVLNEALEREPDELTLRLKRLEVLALLHNKEAFEEEAEEMFAALEGDENHPMWQSVLEYSQHLGSDSPLFHGGEKRKVGTSEFIDPAQQLIDEAQAESHIADLNLNISEALDEDQSEMPVDDSTQLLEELESIASVLDEVLEEERSTTYIPVDMALPESTAEEAAPFKVIEEVAKEPIPTETAAVSEYEELEWQPEGATELVPDEADKAKEEDYQAIRQALEEVEGLEESEPEVVEELQGLEEFVQPEQDVDSMYLLDDEVGSKLDLARAYLEMDENKRAAELLKDVIEDGSEKQQQEAQDLLEKISKSSAES